MTTNRNILNVYQTKSNNFKLSDAIGMRAQNMKNDTKSLMTKIHSRVVLNENWNRYLIETWALVPPTKVKEKPPNKLLLSFLRQPLWFVSLKKTSLTLPFELFPRFELCTDKERDKNMQKDRKERKEKNTFSSFIGSKATQSQNHVWL